MKPSVDQIIAWHTKLQQLYSARNVEYSILRQSFASQDLEVSRRLGAVSEFQDNKRIVYNMINSAVRRFMDEMSAPVFIRAIPRGIDKMDMNLAERRQKALNRLNMFENMEIKKVQAAYYQSLLDKAIWYVRPAPDKPMKVDVGIVVPECYYPIPTSDNWDRIKGVIISWRRFGIDNIGANAMIVDPTIVDRTAADLPQDRVIEYWDDKYFIRVENGKATVDINHDVGVVLFDEAHNIPVPHSHRGQGDADQSIGLNSYLNKLISDQANVLDYMANPIIVVRGTSIAGQQLTWGPRAIWNLERDGSAEILTWAGAPPTFEAQILRVMQGIEDNTGMSSPAFGREIPAGVSGETVRSILAGFNTRVGTKQSLMAKAMADMYRKVQLVWETQFPNEPLEISGEPGPEGGQGNKPQGQGVCFYGKELKGWYDCQVVFQPQNESVRVFTEIQKLDKGIQSKYRTMQNLGIPNPDEEWKRIMLEKSYETIIQQRANAISGGGVPAPGGGMMAPPPGQMRIPNMAELPVNIAETPERGERVRLSSPGQFSAEDLGLGAPKAAGPADIRDIMDRLEDANTTGRAVLVGDIVTEGSTDGRFTIVVDDESDIGRIRQALGGLAGKADIQTKERYGVVEGPTMTVARPKSPAPRQGY